ncbi:DUF58 domain-containing protein [Mesoaciditoga lauensis]|uniref:DUF58 domain-containing protein n=1 Tax=Mesoaciditoga lauensis TaxID=1495039 RepID=UPI000561F444|nr:DUF58 domain-containing protein [Mesoaciditoga lauensis]
MKYDLSSLIALSIFVGLILLISVGPFTLAIASFVAIIWIYFALSVKSTKKLKIKTSVSPQRVFTDDPVECVTSVYNESNFILSNVQLVDFGAESGYVIDESLNLEDEEKKTYGEKSAKGVLKPHSSLSIRYTMGFRTRGEHSFLHVRVVVKGFLGLFKVEKTFNPARSVLVFPKMLPLDTFKTMLIDPVEGEKTDFKLLEDVTHITGVHEYAGEPFQRIHWKISAHLDKLMVKEYEYTASSVIKMYVDYNLPPQVYARNVWSSIRKDYEEYASIAASGMVKYFSDHGMEITLKVLADKIYEVFPQWVRKDYVPYLDVLARARGIDNPSEELLLENVLQKDMYSMSKNSTVVLISLYLTDDVIPKLLTIRSRVSELIAFVMPYGFRMPYHKKYRSFAILPQEVKKLRDQSALLTENNVMVHVLMDNESVDEVIRSYEKSPLETR